MSLEEEAELYRRVPPHHAQEIYQIRYQDQGQSHIRTLPDRAKHDQVDTDQKDHHAWERQKSLMIDPAIRLKASHSHSNYRMSMEEVRVDIADLDIHRDLEKVTGQHPVLKNDVDLRVREEAGKMMLMLLLDEEGGRMGEVDKGSSCHSPLSCVSVCIAKLGVKWKV